MTDWSFVLRSPSGEELELIEATRRTVTWRVDGPATASFETSGFASEAAAIESLATDLLIRRNGTLIYRGRVVTDNDTVDTTDHRVRVETVDYRGLLDLVAVIAETGRSFDNVDRGQIAYDLISDYQARAGASLGITNGLGATSGQTLDVTYEPGASIGSLITELGRDTDGFEWEIAPDLALNRWYPTRGNGARGVFDHGGRVRRVDRSMQPNDFANAWVVTGGRGTAAVADEAANVASDPRGRWERSASYPSIFEPARLTGRAAWLTDQSSTLRPRWTVHLTPERWGGPNDVFIGDEIDLAVRSGRLAFQDSQRVVELAVDLDDSDNETVALGAIPA